jgi:hypothetical protein
MSRTDEVSAMPNGLTNIPEWFPWENQGAGVAVGDLDGTGQLDLVVFMVDDVPEGQNRGLYRIGNALNSDGAVTGGWSPWIDVPDWFPWENQGAGIAVADLDGSGQLDLVVLMVDNRPNLPDGQNRGLYRVGKTLDADGTVTGGWGPWIEVPEWFSWENQGAGIAVADVDGDGQLELVVLLVDNPPQQNQGFYQLGRGPSSDGTVTSWSGWLGIPGWHSWDNQGADVATARIGGREHLVVLLVDAPDGKNAGQLQLLDLTVDPAVQGRWEVLPYLSEVLGVHTATLPGGKVLFFAGSGSSKVRFDDAQFGDESLGHWMSAVWDPAVPPTPAGQGSFSFPATVRDGDDRPIDFFCCGHSYLADGTLLAVGGTLQIFDGPDFRGRKDVLAFDPATEQWSRRTPMAHGRWYPTLVTLGDGRVLAATGLLETPDGPNPQLELYTPDTDSWQVVHVQPNQVLGVLPLYAHLFLIDGGRIFFSGGRMDDPNPQGPCILDLSHDPVTVTAVPGQTAPATRNQSASVLLPLPDQLKVLVIGGAPLGGAVNATDSVEVVDLRAPQPQLTPAAPLGLPRMHLNAVLLPDHTVLVCGGSLQREAATVSRRQAEIYDPETDTWTAAAIATIPRLYHSTAVLLASGQVITAGGNPEGGDQVQWLPPDENEELRLELYSPPYLFRGPRPVIQSAPDELAYGQAFTIDSPAAGSTLWVSIIRPGITTHAFDSSQRLVDLDITAQRNGIISITAPTDPTIAPPGWYMLFVVDQAKVPSIAHWVHLHP